MVALHHRAVIRAFLPLPNETPKLSFWPLYAHSTVQNDSFQAFYPYGKDRRNGAFRTVFLKKGLTELPYGNISTPFFRFFSAE